MASTMNSSPVTNSTRPQVSIKMKKKKKSQIEKIQTQTQNQSESEIKWKSEVEQQLYSSKLLHALQNIQPGSSPDTRPGKIVREAADRVLAATAKGKTRWSRAILKNRLKLKFTKNSKRQRVAVTASSRPSKKPNVSIVKIKSKNLQAVQRKGRVLGRLVPGCKRQSLPVVLEEATDYIAALEMQVRAMAALADLLSGSARPSENC
ncbi:transcription factor bHLH148 [Heracleum sosnowskyi]|uniref:Transcription factor bHLH148 n=1 Tax=Heracleum sosnowskyi TaxID=360622 RepID=A0AAD8IN99_9APIA|nr:transcription factor bHLH148 [Heracleum sosnowskyi]